MMSFSSESDRRGHVLISTYPGRRPKGAAAHANAELFVARVVLAYKVHTRHVALKAHVIRIQFLSVTHRLVDWNVIA